MAIEGYQLKQCSDWWYYLLPLPPSPPQDHIVKNYVISSQDDINMEDSLSRRESFPKHYHVTYKGHRRAFSCAAVVSAHHLIGSSDATTGQLTPDSQFSQPVSPRDEVAPSHPSISHYSSMGSLISKGEGFSGYDASNSNSMTSLSAVSETHNVRQCYSVEEGGSVRFWLLIQVSESDNTVKVLFHTR